MKTKTVEIAGKTYTIPELPSRKNAAWRGRIKAELAGI